jgi:hypothetical protein
MNKLLLLILVLFTNVLSDAQNNKGTNNTKPKNILKVNPVGLFNDHYDIDYERVLNNKSSISFGFSSGTYLNRVGDAAGDDYLKLHGSSPPNINDHIIKGSFYSAEYRYYLSHSTKSIPAGVHITCT